MFLAVVTGGARFNVKNEQILFYSAVVIVVVVLEVWWYEDVHYLCFLLCFYFILFYFSSSHLKYNCSGVMWPLWGVIKVQIFVPALRAFSPIEHPEFENLQVLKQILDSPKECGAKLMVILVIVQLNPYYFPVSKFMHIYIVLSLSSICPQIFLRLSLVSFEVGRGKNSLFAASVSVLQGWRGKNDVVVSIWYNTSV